MMEWMKIDGETYMIEAITTQFSEDQHNIKSVVFVKDLVSEQKIIDLYESGNSFEFETNKWKFTGSRIKSITFDTSGVVFDIVSRNGGMKSIQYERDKRIDELFGYETPDDINDINTEPKNHK
jgi:hypothetical protein